MKPETHSTPFPTPSGHATPAGHAKGISCDASRGISRRSGLALLLGASALGSPLVHASTGAAPWPSKPLRFIAPGPAGSFSDNIVRPIAEHISRALGQPAIVDNKPGANTAIAMGELARAPADGHTLVITNASSMTVNPHIYQKLGYRPEQFTTITPVLKSQLVLTVNPAWAKAQGIDSAKALVDWAKANPGKLRYASVGVGNMAHLMFAMLSNQFGLETVHVPYKGMAPAQMAVMAGEVEAMFDIPNNKPNFDAGKAKVLAVTTAQRIARLPDAPTLAEAGIEGYDVSSWMGFFTNAGTPPATIDRMAHAIGEALKDPRVHAALTLQGDVFTESPTAFAQRVAQESTMWAKVVARESISVE